MKTSAWILAASLLTVGVGAWSLTARAQQGKDTPSGKHAGTDAVFGFSLPGPEHKLLAETVGKWDFTSTMNSPAGPMKSTGTSERKMTMNGWFLEDTTHGTKMGMVFEGHGYTGYDEKKKRYIGVWLDSMAGGAIMPSDGTYDAASKTFSFTTEMPDPAGGYAKETMVEKVIDADHFTTTFNKVGSDGKGPGDFTIEYTRGK
jgi:hypothetical protein